MNILDRAHDLARAIKETEEYRDYIDAREQAARFPEAAALINNFRSKQFDLQRREMLGEDTREALAEQMKDLNELVTANPVAAYYMQVELRYTMMINDVYTILGDVIKSDAV